MSKCWLTVMSLVPSSGLMVFQGVGFSFVQTTAWRVRDVYRESRTRAVRRTIRAAGEARQIPPGTDNDDADDSVANLNEPESTTEDEVLTLTWGLPSRCVAVSTCHT